MYGIDFKVNSNPDWLRHYLILLVHTRAQCTATVPAGPRGLGANTNSRTELESSIFVDCNFIIVQHCSTPHLIRCRLLRFTKSVIKPVIFGLWSDFFRFWRSAKPATGEKETRTRRVKISVHDHISLRGLTSRTFSFLLFYFWCLVQVSLMRHRPTASETTRPHDYKNTDIKMFKNFKI